MTSAAASPGCTRSRIGALLLRLFAASALLLLARPWAITAGIGSRGMVARQLAAAPPSQAAILPTAHSGVHRYSIPGEFDKVAPAKGSCKRAGVLHIYLKALRWPVEGGGHHLRMNGFVAFEVTSWPQHWNTTTLTTFMNIPEIKSLRLILRSAAGWQREVPVLLAGCGAAGDVQACSDKRAKEIRPAYEMGIVSLDFGPTAAVDFDLLVQGWPRRVSLKRQLQAALAAPPAEAGAGGGAGAGTGPPPPVYRATPYFYSLEAGTAGAILAWLDEYYQPLGLAGTIMYVLPKDEVELAAQPRIRELVAAGRLVLVLWDEFSWYEGWRDFDLQIVENHALLSFWGRNVRVLVADVDELIVPAVPGDTLPSMLAPGGCMAAPGMRQECLALDRRNIFPLSDMQPESFPYEPAWWANTRGPNPLPKYRYVGMLARSPKVLVHPGRVAPVNVHLTTICTGKTAVADGSSSGRLGAACDKRAACTWVPPECASIVHIPNMLVARRPIAKAVQIQPPNWLWMLGGPEDALLVEGSSPRASLDH